MLLLVERFVTRLGCRQITTVSARRILGVTKEASLEEVKTSYRKLALKFHPDLSTAETAAADFNKVQIAYDHLKDGFLGVVDKNLSTSEQLQNAKRTADHSFCQRIFDDCLSPDPEKLSAEDMNIIVTVLGMSPDDTMAFYLRARHVFLDGAEEAKSWNNVLRTVNAGEESHATMDELLRILDVMDKHGIQPELSLMQEVFTYFPK